MKRGVFIFGAALVILSLVMAVSKSFNKGVSAVPKIKDDEEKK